eukprot:GSChrysophyteH1.ASY1.ANO1.1448.1 assembled CDS
MDSVRNLSGSESGADEFEVPNPTLFILGCSVLSIFWAAYQYKIIAETSLDDSMNDSTSHAERTSQMEVLREVYEAVRTGANSFLRAEYSICLQFVLGFSVLIVCLIGWGQGLSVGLLTMISFLLGAITSMVCGYIGMYVAEGFNTAFRAGAVMGFALTGLGILVIVMFDCLSGYGLGGSSIAMFGRVGGGIYTKAADVGADLVGKVIEDLPEDSPRNPATIADNVGDNVGDVAGMGADLFGSFAESTCAALVIAAGTPDLRQAGWGAICFPLVVSSAGILVCLATSFVATHLTQLIISTLVMVPASIGTYTRDGAVMCIVSGAVGGLLIGLVTEYYTSFGYEPVRELARSCKTGAATNIIYGLSLGYKSVIVPVIILATIIYSSFHSCDLYGVALAAVGMLGNLATGLTIDAYGPVCDNAGGIAEMAEMPHEVREKTDALDAAGNTTAAVGKGFAIGSAALVSLALYGAFFGNVQVLTPLVFAFLLIGSMLPFWFSALTMKSVGDAAAEMVVEVQRQFAANPELLNPNTTMRPDYDACIKISTEASLREMIAPGALVIGVQMAISMSNTGGAWDNAKKYISGGYDESLGGKGSEFYKAAVIGDTVGDPLKDTSGPALNILMKLMAILSLVFADYFYAINEGRGILNMPVH